MKKSNINSIGILLFSLQAYAASVTQASPANYSSLEVINLKPDQVISEKMPVTVQIRASSDIENISVLKNGLPLVIIYENENHSFQWNHTFTQTGAVELSFIGRTMNNAALVEVKKQVTIKGTDVGNLKHSFNAYVLKAVDYLTKNHGLLGYNIDSENTHTYSYGKYGQLTPSGGGKTMCVAGVLETIVTAFNIYQAETGDNSVFEFLPFDSWKVIRDDTIKAHIWVDEQNLHSYGTADAIAKFGIGEHVAFSNLEPGSFININRETGSGHAVVFLNFIDKAGNEVTNYDSSVAGFRYFGSQGKSAKGEGGFDYRWAFFSKDGCPDIPYKRDCNVIYSENQTLLNTGSLLMPKEWHRNSTEYRFEKAAGFHDPKKFNGLTVDD